MNFYQLPIVQKLYTKKASVFTLRHNVEIDLEPQPSVVAALVWSVSGSASSISLGRLLCRLEQGRRQGSVSERFGACSEGMFFVFRFIRRPRLPLLLLSLLSIPSLTRMPARSTPLRSAWSCWMKWTFHSYVQVEFFLSRRRDWTTPLPRLWRMFSSTSIWARVSLQRIFSLRYIFFFSIIFSRPRSLMRTTAVCTWSLPASTRKSISRILPLYHFSLWMWICRISSTRVVLCVSLMLPPLTSTCTSSRATSLCCPWWMSTRRRYEWAMQCYVLGPCHSRQGSDEQRLPQDLSSPSYERDLSCHLRWWCYEVPQVSWQSFRGERVLSGELKERRWIDEFCCFSFILEMLFGLLFCFLDSTQIWLYEGF